MTEHGKQIMDGLSVAAVLGALTDILPPVAALFTIVWTGIQIYESETFKRIFRKCKSS